MVGYFQTASFYFLLDDDGKRSARHQKDFHEELGARISRMATLPDLGPAPLGSWFIPRLAELTAGKMGLLHGEERRVDGGSCVLDIEVFSPEQKHVASLQIQCSDQVVVFGTCNGAEEPDEILDELAHSMAEDPGAVREFEVRVLNPENGSRRVYGFDGSHYLGHRSEGRRAPKPDRT